MAKPVKQYHYNQHHNPEETMAYAFQIEEGDDVRIDSRCAKPGDYFVIQYSGSVYFYSEKEFNRFFDPIDCECSCVGKIEEVKEVLRGFFKGKSSCESELSCVSPHSAEACIQGNCLFLHVEGLPDRRTNNLDGDQYHFITRIQDMGLRSVGIICKDGPDRPIVPLGDKNGAIIPDGVLFDRPTVVTYSSKFAEFRTDFAVPKCNLLMRVGEVWLEAKRMKNGEYKWFDKDK